MSSTELATTTTTRSMCDLSISDRLLRVLSASEHDRGTGRAILKLLRPVVLRFSHAILRPLPGNGAVYCALDDVQDIVRNYYGDKELFLRQSRRAQNEFGNFTATTPTSI